MSDSGTPAPERQQSRSGMPPGMGPLVPGTAHYETLGVAKTATASVS